MTPDLAILIVTLKRRRPYLARLMRRLEPQLSERVVVLTLEDEGAETIGFKRQRMIDSEPARAAKFVAFVDDDDLVAPTYCADVLAAVDQGADVVGFWTRYYADGRLGGDGLLSMGCGGWTTVRDSKTGSVIHKRWPNHLSPVRSEYAREIGYPSLMSGEDADYSMRLVKRFPNMREVFIGEIDCPAEQRRHEYFYYYRTPRLRKESEDMEVADPAVPC